MKLGHARYRGRIRGGGGYPGQPLWWESGFGGRALVGTKVLRVSISYIDRDEVCGVCAHYMY